LGTISSRQKSSPSVHVGANDTSDSLDAIAAVAEVGFDRIDQANIAEIATVPRDFRIGRMFVWFLNYRHRCSLVITPRAMWCSSM
jgi:hypothetical protein